MNLKPGKTLDRTIIYDEYNLTTGRNQREITRLKLSPEIINLVLECFIGPKTFNHPKKSNV